jgi:hypothetical protein
MTNLNKEQLDRSSLILPTLLLLASCAPIHPTHPTKAECPLTIETTFSARLDRSPPAVTGISPTEGDPCSAVIGGARVERWQQQGEVVAPVCMAAGTTPEQATSHCSDYLGSTDFPVGVTRLEARSPTGGRICPSTVTEEGRRVVRTGGEPQLHPEQCREGPTWPLVP